MRLIQDVRDACARLPGTHESFPFDAHTLVFKVGAVPGGPGDHPAARAGGSWKMFALAALDADPPRLSVKCEPALGERLCGAYPGVVPGYHLNKRHWITVTLDGALPDALLLDLLVGSYRLVRAALPAPVRAVLHDVRA